MLSEIIFSPSTEPKYPIFKVELLIVIVLIDPADLFNVLGPSLYSYQFSFCFTICSYLQSRIFYCFPAHHLPPSRTTPMKKLLLPFRLCHRRCHFGWELSTAELFNNSLRVALSLLKTIISKRTSEKILSVFPHPEFDLMLFAKRIKPFEQCRKITRGSP